MCMYLIIYQSHLPAPRVDNQCMSVARTLVIVLSVLHGKPITYFTYLSHTVRAQTHKIGTRPSNNSAKDISTRTLTGFEDMRSLTHCTQHALATPRTKQAAPHLSCSSDIALCFYRARSQKDLFGSIRRVRTNTRDMCLHIEGMWQLSSRHLAIVSRGFLGRFRTSQ
jgi:hypothetical protein